MVPVLSLWLPILLSAVLVFVLSFLFHMVLTYHRTDVQAVPSEAAVMDALRTHAIPVGNYVMPHASTPAAMKDPQFMEKRRQGPVAILTVLPSGEMNMGKTLVQWFLYAVAVSILAAYVAGRALEPGADYGAAFRFAGATAFAAYAIGGWSESIWWGRKWSTTLKNTFDGLVYALMTGGVFGWLWP